MAPPPIAIHRLTMGATGMLLLRQLSSLALYNRLCTAKTGWKTNDSYFLSFSFVRSTVKTFTAMAQHVKTWYRDHRDRDRPACEAMEPLSDKLAGQTKATQRGKLGYVIAPSLMDRLETSTIGGAMMHDSLTAASRAVHSTRGEAINVTLTSGHGTQSQDLVKSMERAWARQNHAVVKQNKDILKSAEAVDAKKP